MSNHLIECLIDKNYTELQNHINKILYEKSLVKIEELKKIIISELYNDIDVESLLNEARYRIIRARIRNGKIQRRKIVSTVSGYSYRGGRLVRMTASERRNRKMGARRAKIKRRNKQYIAIRKRSISLSRRKRYGL